MTNFNEYTGRRAKMVLSHDTVRELLDIPKEVAITRMTSLEDPDALVVHLACSDFPERFESEEAPIVPIDWFTLPGGQREEWIAHHE